MAAHYTHFLPSPSTLRVCQHINTPPHLLTTITQRLTRVRRRHHYAQRGAGVLGAGQFLGYKDCSVLFLGIGVGIRALS